MIWATDLIVLVPWFAPDCGKILGGLQTFKSKANITVIKVFEIKYYSLILNPYNFTGIYSLDQKWKIFSFSELSIGL